MRNVFFILVTVFVIAGCKKIDNGVPAIKGATLIITTPVTTSLTGPEAFCTSSLDLSATDYTYGFCYSLNRNPTIPGINNTSDNYTAGSFSAILTKATFGKKYYVRAFIANGFATTYSNQDSFFIPLYTFTDTVKNITARSFDVGVYTLPSIADSITERGICYDTITAPDINDWKTISTITDTGKILISVNDTLKPGKTYYARSYLIANGRPLYGNEVNFKTAGHKGSYGYIIFDKGDTTNGWRYVEAALDSITRTGITWGCSATDIAGTLTNTGSGLANTDAIVSSCTDTTTAAFICLNLTLKTRTDWFLPSLDEVKALYQLKQSAVITRTATVFTSSQATPANCFVLDFSTGEQQQLSKSSSAAIIWPVRRYK